MGLDQEWQVEAGNRRRAWRRVGLDENDCRQNRRNRSGCSRGDDIKRKRDMMRRLGRHQLFAAGQGTFAAIVGIAGGCAFALLAAAGGFPGKWPATEAVERLQQQKHHHQAHRNLNATPHSASGYQIAKRGGTLTRSRQLGIQLCVGSEQRA